MRAARIHERNGRPVVEDIEEPPVVPGTVRVKVCAAGLQPTDIMRARGLYKAPDCPYIIGGAGIGTLDGRRVYFGQPVTASGAVSEWAIVPETEVWPLPDDVQYGQAIALGVAGGGALVPLEKANIQPGEQILVLGATGPLGQIALQLARLLGAGRVVAAARGQEGLQRVRHLADEIVVLGTEDDVAALKQGATGGGYDVVLDCVYGAPAEAAMRATAFGGRMMSIGINAGPTVTLSLADLVRREHHGVSTGHLPAEERHAIFDRLLAWHRQGKIMVDIFEFVLDEVDRAWTAQQGSPGGKVIVRMDG